MSNVVPKRSEVPKELTWDLESIYRTRSHFDFDFERVQALLPQLKEFQGRLLKNGHTLRDALKMRDEINQTLEKLGQYSSLRLDEDTTNTVSQEAVNRVASLETEVKVATAFITEELLAASPRRIQGLLKRYRVLRVYRQQLAEMELEREGFLGAEKEGLLSQVDELGAAPSQIYSSFSNADFQMASVADSAGVTHQVTSANYYALMESPDRLLRKRAYDSRINATDGMKYGLAQCYNAHVRADVISTRVRGYQSCLAYNLEYGGIPVSLYDSLIETVRKNLPKFHRYLQLRKRILGVPELQTYDLLVPLAPGVQYRNTFAEAKETVLGALAPLGKTYVRNLRKGYEARWVDVMENVGKNSGSYSYGCYGTHPFILLNWQSNLSSLFTLAHESGHSMHSFMTWNTQPYIYSTYTLFVAEVASHVNEFLLARHLLETLTDSRMRMLVINYILDLFSTTLFHCTQMAEFERETHAMVEQGKTLSVDVLGRLYCSLTTDYYGGGGWRSDHSGDVGWSTHSHLFNSFYDYQYATGVSAAVALVDQLGRSGRSAGLKRYLTFLSSGCSDMSMNLLAEVGVDLNTTEPIQKALNVFGEYTDELEKLAKKLVPGFA